MKGLSALGGYCGGTLLARVGPAVILWAGFLSGCGTLPSPGVKVSFGDPALESRVRALLSPRRPDGEALRGLEELLESHPGNVALAWALADRAARAGREKEAEKAFASLPWPFREAALARLEAEKDPGRALKRLKKILRKDPGFYPALYLEGRIYSQEGKWEKAQEALVACLERAPRWPPALFEAARVLAARKKPREAASYLGRYLAFRPEDQEARLFRLRLFLSPGGDLSGARRELRRLKKSLPGDPRVRLMEGALRELEGKLRKAAEIYRSLLEVEDRDVRRRAAFNLGYLLMKKLGDPKGAYRAFQVFLSCPAGESLADKVDLLRVRTWLLELKEKGAALPEQKVPPGGKGRKSE